MFACVYWREAVSQECGSFLYERRKETLYEDITTTNDTLK